MLDQEGDLSNALNGRVPANSQLLYDRGGKPSLVKKACDVNG